MMFQARGMTLVEVVVATALFSMIMLATVTALRTFAMTYDRVQQQADKTSQIREGDRFIRRVLQDALNAEGLFEGTPTTMHWVAPLDRAGDASGLQHLQLTLDGERLLLSFAPLRASLEEPDWGQVAADFPLIEGIEKLAFFYQAEPLGEWTSSYVPANNSINTLPWSVAIEIIVAGRQWPPILICMDRYRQSQ
jgi:general secretion pathway protein J